jgi:hypothetical protein
MSMLHFIPVTQMMYAETDTTWRGNVELGNKNRGTTKKLSKGNIGPNFAKVWKTLKSSQNKGTVFAERFIPRP